MNILRTMTAEHFDILCMLEEQIPVYFSSPKEVLQHLKHTGVNGMESTSWTKSDLCRFTTEFEKYYFENKGYPLTYNPIYMICKKKIHTQQ